MAALLAVALLVVLAHRMPAALRPASGCEQSRRGEARWHVAMAGAMTWMLLAPPRGALAAALVAVFAVGALHAVVAGTWSGRDRSTRVGAGGRLALGCTAMVVMLWPAVSAPAPAVADVVRTVSGHHGDLVARTVGHVHGAVPDPSSPVAWVGVAVLVAVVAVGAGAVVRTVGGRGGPGSSGTWTRGDACCESVMSAATVWMLAGPVLALVAG